MLKAGIVTKIGKNYGAVLQAYALKRKLCEMGVDAYVIKYTPPFSNRTYKICRHPWRFRGVFANVSSICHKKTIQQGITRFFTFREEYLNLLGSYCNDQEIESNPPACDIYIAGSDQVWNPVNSFDRTYYCMFANKIPTSRRASYAASIGLKVIPEKMKAEFADRIRAFDYISVREKQAQYVLSTMGIPAKLAPDPTLLFTEEEWNSIAVDTIKEPYILCYFVSYPGEIRNTVQAVKKKLGYRVVNIILSEESSVIGDIKVRDAGPLEFLGLVKNASFVITSSFHGTVFSIINRKPFVTSLYQQTSSRVTELLANLELTNRIIEPGETQVDAYCEDFPYPEQINEKMKAMRISGETILKEIVDSVK